MSLAAGPALGQADSLKSRLVERAAQTREIVYFLQQPETHAFSLYHDYTETNPKVGQYLNVVRAGSRVSNPSAIDLDTGAPLDTKILTGAELAGSGIQSEEPVSPTTEVVVIRFPPPPAGGSVRLRISETYSDPARYRMDGEDLIWDRAFGRARNAVVLPSGWRLTHSSIPAVVSLTDDGRIRLDFVNPRPDQIDVLIVAKRRVNGARSRRSRSRRRAGAP
jgi:hypothetical protein